MVWVRLISFLVEDKMPNPFDQFDSQTPAPQAEGNPFDAFDPKTANDPNQPNEPMPVLPHEDPALQAQWAKSGTMDRLKMMIPWLNDNAARVIATDTPALPIAKAVLQGSGAAVGGLAGTFAGGMGAVPGAMAGSALGNYAGQKLEQQFNPEAQVKPGQVAGAALMGMIPGTSLANASIPQIAKEGLKYGLANTAGGTAESLIDEKRMPTLGEAAAWYASGAAGAPIAAFMDSGNAAAGPLAAKSLMAARDNTLETGRAAGYAIPAVMGKLNKNAVSKIIESTSNRGDLKWDFALHNAPTTTKLAAEEVGLDASKPVTYAAIDQKIQENYKPYQELAAISPQAADTLDAYKAANEAKNDLWRDYNHPMQSNRTGLRKQYDYQKNLADGFEQDLEALAAQGGKPGLVDDLRDAKVNLAKLYAVKNATNDSTGMVSAKKLSDQYTQSRPLTGNLQTITQMYRAFPQFMQDAEKVPGPGVGKSKLIEAAGAAGAILGGGSHFGVSPIVTVPTAALAATAPFRDSAARGLLYSKLYQQSRFAQPDYGNLRPDLGASFLRYASTRGLSPQLQSSNNTETTSP